MLHVALPEFTLSPGKHFRKAVEGIAFRRLDDEGDVEAASLIQPPVGLGCPEGVELGDLLAKINLLFGVPIDLDQEWENPACVAHLRGDLDEGIGGDFHLLLTDLPGHRMGEVQ